MPITTSVNLGVVNVGFQGANQFNTRTVGLANGGTAVVWQDAASISQMYVRIYDALGNATGGPTAVAVGNLNDVTLTVDGRIAVASVQSLTQMQVHFLNATTGVTEGVTSGPALGGGSITSLQIVPTDDGGVMGLLGTMVSGTLRFEADFGNASFLNQSVVSLFGGAEFLREVLDIGAARCSG